MIREKMQNIQMKRVVILSIPYLIIFYLADKCFWLYRHCMGRSMIEKICVMLMNFPLAFANWFPSFYLQDLLGGVIVALIFRIVLYYKAKNAKKFRHGEEYGSARWGNRKDIEPFEDPVFENNIILTETERLTMNTSPKAPKYARNINVIVIGGSGSGKTRFYVKPQLLQMQTCILCGDRSKGDDHCRMWKDASKWRLSDQGAEYDQFQKVDALQSIPLHP